MTTRSGTGEENPKIGLSRPDSAQSKELMTAQMIAHFCHTNHELFSGIENGLTRLKHSPSLDQSSLAIVEMLIRACVRGNEIAVQMLASSRTSNAGTDIEKT